MIYLNYSVMYQVTFVSFLNPLILLSLFGKRMMGGTVAKAYKQRGSQIEEATILGNMSLVNFGVGLTTI